MSGDVPTVMDFIHTVSRAIQPYMSKAMSPELRDQVRDETRGAVQAHYKAGGVLYDMTGDAIDSADSVRVSVSFDQDKNLATLHIDRTVQ